LAVPSGAASTAPGSSGGRSTTASPAPAVGKAASGGPVIVVLKHQHANLNLRTQAGRRTAATHADQAPVVADIKAHGGSHITRLVAPNAVAAHVSAAEVRRLRGNPAVAEIVPDSRVQVRPPGAAPPTQAARKATPPPQAARKAGKAGKAARRVRCPFNPRPSRPLQPEALADIHASSSNPNARDMANRIATGKGVIVANAGMNSLAGNPNFQRPDGSHVVIDAPDYTADHGGAESYGDASSIAAQGTVVYQYAKALPQSSIPAGCTFVIKGDAPGASLVDLTQIDTPILPMSKVLAGIDRVVSKVHADVISESFGASSLPGSFFGQLLTKADNAAVDAGVTVVESSGDSGPSGTVISAADDPKVIAAGAVDNFRLIAMDDGYRRYVSDNMAALSSGGTAPTGKVVNLVAPGWYGGEAACAVGSDGCPPTYPTESMRGTSESAPFIAGAAADVIQAYRGTHHGASPTPAVVKNILTSTATDIHAPADQQGDGLLNVYRAVKAAQQMPGTTDAHGPGDAPALVVSPLQLDLSGRGGSTSHRSIHVYNTSDSPTTVTATYRRPGRERRIGRVVREKISAPPAGQPIPPEGATAARTIHFHVPPGLDRLDVDMRWPDPTNGNILQFQLFNPRGAFTQESWDDPGGGHTINVPTHDVSNIQHAALHDPMPGRWTARILWAGLDVDLSSPPATPGTYRGPMFFKVSGQHYRHSRAAAPVRIPGHSSARIPLRIHMPRRPGDHPESVQLSAGNGASVSLPVARRTLIPRHGGAFRTLITSSVGRGVGQISTYEINVPRRRRYLNVRLHTRDASPDNGYTFYLVNPSGTVVDTDTTPKTINGRSVARAQLYTNHPAAGVWQIDVVLDLTTSGKEFTQTVHGRVRDPGPRRHHGHR
ncbi:MAG: S8 family serine peptidase, partial [Nocardioidaceae bacterium]